MLGLLRAVAQKPQKVPQPEMQSVVGLADSPANASPYLQGRGEQMQAVEVLIMLAVALGPLLIIMALTGFHLLAENLFMPRVAKAFERIRRDSNE